MPGTRSNICPVPAGKLLIIGGAENKGEEQAAKKSTPSNFERLEILKSLISLTGKQSPVIQLFTSASTVGDESFEDYKKAFTELNVDTVEHVHHDTRQQVIDDEGCIERINQCDAVFFAGGSQLKYAHLYGGTSLLTALKYRYIKEPIVIAGTSAGAMVMSTPMIYAGNNEVQELGGMIKVTTGLEFLKDVCIDTHFVHRGRFVRLAQVIATNPGCIGLGIEEDTAVIVREGLEMEVIGTGTIILIEGYNISQASIDDFTSDNPITIRNLQVHILSAKDTYTLCQINPPHI